MQLARQMDEQRERSQLGHAQVISQFGDRDQSGVACRRQIEHADAHYVPGQPLGCVFPGSSSTVAVHEARQNDRRIVLGSGWVDSGRVFTLADGSPLRPSWIGKTVRSALHRGWATVGSATRSSALSLAFNLVAVGARPRLIMNEALD